MSFDFPDVLRAVPGWHEGRGAARGQDNDTNISIRVRVCNKITDSSPAALVAQPGMAKGVKRRTATITGNPQERKSPNAGQQD